MRSEQFAILAVQISQHYGDGFTPPEACRMASKLIYHQRRLGLVKGEKEIEKILGKVRELTGIPWEEEGLRLIGPWQIPL